MENITGKNMAHSKGNEADPGSRNEVMLGELRLGVGSSKNFCSFLRKPPGLLPLAPLEQALPQGYQRGSRITSHEAGPSWPSRWFFFLV